MDKLAQAKIELGPKGGFQGFGALGLEGKNPEDAPNIFSNAISTTIGVITVVAIVWFLIQLLTGAISIIGSGGDKGKMESAKNKITSGVIGLVVVIAGLFILDFIGSLFGLELLNVGGAILNLVQ